MIVLIHNLPQTSCSSINKSILLFTAIMMQESNCRKRSTTEGGVSMNDSRSPAVAVLVFTAEKQGVGEAAVKRVMLLFVWIQLQGEKAI